MVATAPRILPPGFLSLDGALDRVDPGLLSDIGTDEEHREYDKFVCAGKWQSDNNGIVLAPSAIHEEFARRARRREAFKRICELCAYGTVPSALLLDDFSVRAGVPSIFWLDERFSVNMRDTGRAPMTKPRDQYAVDGPSGWVMVEAASLECVLAVAPVDSFGQPGTAHTLRATATNTDPATILRSALDDASVGVSDTGRTTDATTTKRPFSARDAMSLLVAKKRFGPWAAPPTEAVSREFLEGEFHRVPRKAHRALRKEVWGSLIRKGPPSKSAK